MLAAIGGLIVDMPAAGVRGQDHRARTCPGGLEIADTVVQDIGFVLAAVSCRAARRARGARLAVRAAPAGRWAGGGPRGLILLLLVAFIVFSVIWVGAVNAGKEKLLEQLGANESTSLLLLSAALTCVVAPICEEFLFRGFIFTALRNWQGTWPAAIITGLVFGGVHAGSAPAVDLVPLAGARASGCACCTATRARCIRASWRTR